MSVLTNAKVVAGTLGFFFHERFTFTGAEQRVVPRIVIAALDNDGVFMLSCNGQVYENILTNTMNNAWSPE